jgi:hypothetical protein
MLQKIKDLFNSPSKSDMRLAYAKLCGILEEREKTLADKEAVIVEMMKNGGYGYRAQHIEFLNKEVLRLGGLCRELSQNNEKLNAENMELSLVQKKKKK